MKKTCKTILFLLWIYSNILTTANETPEYKYFSEGEIIILKCMGDAKKIDWIGPAQNSSNPSPVLVVDRFGDQNIWNTTTYATGRVINPDIPNFSRLKVVDTGGKGDFDLQISNASIFDEGFYRCEIEPVEGKPMTKNYILQLTKLPRNLTIDFETDEGTIFGIEGEILKIACNVESGSPPETIYWKHNGSILQTGGPRRNVYVFHPSRTVHNSTLTCEVVNNITDKPLIKTVQLDIRYTPIVLINRGKTMPLFEGEKASLCCEIDSNPYISFMLWSKEGIIIPHTINSSCLFFKRLDRKNSGNYSCFAKNEVGNGSFVTSLTVYYPPSVYLVNTNFSINESKRAVHCKGVGEPHNITFFRVEHTSYFDEHIRYLNVSFDGIAHLPSTTESERYQDTGFYLCNASNGVYDEKGNEFQHSKAYLVSSGPPVFVAANRKIQYGQIGNPMDVTIQVYSTTAIECLNLNAIGRMPSDLLSIEMLTKTVPLKIAFYGVNITANGTEVTFRLVKLNSFGNYNVTVCNQFSANYFIAEVRPNVSGATNQTGTNSTSIIAGCTVSGFIALMVIMKVIWMKRQHTNSINIEEVSDVVEGISQTIENVLYQTQGQPITEHPSPVSTLLPDVSSDNTDTLSHNMEEINQENRLNYADVVFQPTSQNELRIIGLEDRTVYADVNTSVAAALLPDTQSETSSSDDDFVYVDGIENFIEKRETND